MSSIDWCIDRLKAERSDWRKDHPYGYVAKPIKFPNGLTNFMVWECIVPYKPSSDTQEKFYNIKIIFTNNYPLDKPIVKHYDEVINLNLLDEWSPCTTIKMILKQIKKDLENKYNG